jgi:hypothetical protein
LAVRYLASVALTLAASWAAATVVTLYNPEWRGEMWAVRMLAALAAGLFLHPVIAASPRLLGDLSAFVIDWVRGRTGAAQNRSKAND